MPADYLAVRDSCINRKKKKNSGEISEKEIAECKKMASIWYYKKHGKPVEHADIKEIDLDETETQILNEQIEIFGSLENHNQWNLEKEDDE